MPVVYKPCQSTIANRSGKKLFYPRVKLTGNVDTNTVAREIAELSSLTSGDVKNVIDNLITVVTRHLQSSESVTLDGFGSFRYALKTTGGGVENATDVSASLAQLMVRFLPACRRATPTAHEAPARWWTEPSVYASTKSRARIFPPCPMTARRRKKTVEEEPWDKPPATHGPQTASALRPPDGTERKISTRNIQADVRLWSK